MTEWSHYLLSFILLLVLAPYIFAPVILRAKQSVNPHPSLLATTLAEIPERAAAYFGKINESMQSLGFDHAKDLHIPDFADGQSWYLRIFLHSHYQDSAVAIDMMQDMPRGSGLHKQFIEFNSSFSDQSELSLSNNDMLRQPGTCPNRVVIALPGFHDIARMYRLHGELKLFYGNGDTSILPARENLLSELQDSIEREMHCAERAGYMWLDTRNGRCRPTWKGAILMSWLQMPPLRQLRAWWTQRKARRILALCP